MERIDRSVRDGLALRVEVLQSQLRQVERTEVRALVNGTATLGQDPLLDWAYVMKGRDADELVEQVQGLHDALLANMGRMVLWHSTISDSSGDTRLGPDYLARIGGGLEVFRPYHAHRLHIRPTINRREGVMKAMKGCSLPVMLDDLQETYLDEGQSISGVRRSQMRGQVFLVDDTSRREAVTTHVFIMDDETTALWWPAKFDKSTGSVQGVYRALGGR